MIKKFAKALSLTAMMVLPLTTLIGCDRDEGGMEEIGENMDEAATDFANAVEDTCEDAKESANAENTNC
ncbi:hypothetical protein [Litorivivens sp.]|uniref:hypothetical protein n=1 Tax=Litorivivens sp. TaxID=2020868 RepID=UPI0035626826